MFSLRNISSHMYIITLSFQKIFLCVECDVFENISLTKIQSISLYCDFFNCRSFSFRFEMRVSPKFLCVLFCGLFYCTVATYSECGENFLPFGNRALSRIFKGRNVPRYEHPW